jgi:predicted anti-sigma-YlaC factor YlaD
MNCKDLKELLSAYVDGELSRTQREFVEEHLAVCADCKATLESYRAVNQRITSLRETPTMPDRKNGIMSKIREKRIRKPTQQWLRPALAIITVIAAVAALIGVEFWGVGPPEGTGVMMPPPLSRYIRGYTYSLALVAGVLMMAGLAFRSRFARRIAGFMSIVFGGIGVYLGLDALLAVIKSDQSLIMGIIPFFGLITGTVYLKKQTGRHWSAVVGLAFCLAALVLYIIFLVNFHHYWLSWLFLAAAIAIPASVIGYNFHSEITGFFSRWHHPALAAIPVVAILIALTVLQPWSSFPGPQSVIAKAYAATEGLLSYRTSSSITYTYKGEVNNQSSEWEYVFPDRAHGRLRLGLGTFEFIIIGDKQYIRESDNASGKISIGVSASGSTHSKEDTLRLLDSLTKIEKLPDEGISGVDCLHLLGEIDLQKRAERAKASLDPDYPAYEEAIKSIDEQMMAGRETVEVWIGKEDYLIRQVKHEGHSSSEGGSLDTFSSVVKYYDFNKSILIEPPLDAEGNLLPGWRVNPTLSKEIFFDSRTHFEITGEDPAHQQINASVTVTNVAMEATARNVRVELRNSEVIKDGDESTWIKAEPSNSEPVILKRGESETFNASWEYDISHIAGDEVNELLERTVIKITYLTPEGAEAERMYTAGGAVYPSARPPANPPGK